MKYMQAERPLQEVNSHGEVNSCDIAAALLVRKWCAKHVGEQVRGRLFLGGWREDTEFSKLFFHYY